ncbi:MAG: cyclic nucleotide-binding domain-containing protein [Desulfovibrionaceae bacterium]
MTKKVSDKFVGKRVQCPKCGPNAPEVVITPDDAAPNAAPPQVMPPAAHDAQGAGEEELGLVHCRKCGLRKEVPGRLIGRTAKCPQCAAPVTVERRLAHEPTEADVDVDEVVEAAAREREMAETVTERPQEEAAPQDAPSPALDIETPPLDAGAVGFFQGSMGGNLLSGVLSGIVAFFFSLAFASLLFHNGPLAGHFPHGLSMVLISAALVGFGVALGSRIPFAVGGPETVGMALMFLLTQSILHRMGATYDADAVYATVIVSMALSTLVLGLALVRLGKMQAGVWMRFVPYPVVAGLLAAVGLLLVKGGYAVATGRELTLAEVGLAPGLWQIFTMPRLADMPGLETILSSLPAFALGLILFIVLARARNLLAMAGVLLASMGVGVGFLVWRPTFLPDYMADNLLFEPFARDPFWSIYSLDIFGKVAWNVVFEQAPYFVALIGLVSASVMLKVTNLEIAKGREVELDEEYGALGMVNFFTGLVGGVPGSLSLNRSLGARAAGAGGPISGLTASLLCAVALWYGHLATPYIPHFIPAGLLIYAGLGLMKAWLVDIKAELTRADDYVLLLGIFMLAAVFGLLLGLGIGAALALMVMISRSGKVPVVKHSLSGANHRSNVDRAPSQLALLKERGGQIYVLRLQGFIFLGTAHDLMKQIRARVRDSEQPHVRFIMLDFTLVSGLDSSVAITFTKLKQLANEEMFTLIFTNVLFEVEQQLEQAGYTLNDPDGSSTTFMNLDYAMEWCENNILEEAGLLAVREKTLPELLEPIFPEPVYIPRLMEFVTQVRTRKGEPVFKQGDPSDSMYFVESGMVNVELSLGGAKVLRLKKMGPGTVFGEMGLYTTAPRSASIVAAEDCVCYRLSTDTLQSMQKKDPHLVSAIHRFIVTLLSGRVAEANTKIRDLQQ